MEDNDFYYDNPFPYMAGYTEFSKLKAIKEAVEHLAGNLDNDTSYLYDAVENINKFIKEAECLRKGE